ncbi:MAG: hypothetical protein H6Q90_961 [Deltaproteobacteria bacterium]|nr:hypothetical protein [Deltaproteobacteria bacterium]
MKGLPPKATGSLHSSLAYASLALAALIASACGAGDDTVEGTRASCAFGGAITDCPDAARTPEGVCWRLVDCGAIIVQSDDPNRFDWGDCVDDVDRLTSDRQALVMGCIAASTCDELRTSDLCGLFGDQ